MSILTNRDRQILKIAIPSIISNITVPLLGLVDLAIVGHMKDDAYIGAIAVGSMIFNVIYWVFGFLRMGTSGMTSQALGKRDLGDVTSLLYKSLLVGLSIALIFVIFQKPLWFVAMKLMSPSANIQALTSSYFNICIWGAPAMLSLYAFTGWFIGMQNTRIPMLISISQNIVNILCSLTFVYGFGLKIEGVALGTLIAQWSGVLMAVFLIFRYYFKLSKYFKINVFKYQEFIQFFKVNRDIFLRTLCVVLVSLFFTSFGARQGDLILSVNTLLMTFFTLFSYIMDGFAFAGEALSGKYYGADNKQAFSNVKGHLIIWGLLMVVLFTLLYFGFGNLFLKLLTNDEHVIQATSEYIAWIYLLPIAGVFAFIYDGIFIGTTQTRGMLISSLIAAVVFFVVLYIFYQQMHNHALWMAFILYLMLRGIIQYLYLRLRFKW